MSTRLNTVMSLLLCSLSVATAFGQSGSQPLTPGNLVVVQIEQDANNGRFNGLGSATRLREFSLSGSAFNGNDLVFGANGGGLVLRGNDVPDGQLQRSPNGLYLSMIGYTAASGGDVFAAGRSIARIDSSFTSTNFANNAQAGALARSAITNDGVNFFISGNFDGVVSLNTAGGNTIAAPYSTAPANLRVAQFGADGTTVHVSGANAPGQYVNVIAPGGGAITPVIGPSNFNNANDFHFVSPTLLYVAASGGAAPGLERWERINSVWTRVYTLTDIDNSGLGAIAVTTDASGNNVIYGTTVPGVPFSGNRLVSIIDTGANSAWTTLATATSTTAFRGVEFTPIPAPTAATAIIGAAMLAGRRRR